MENNNANNPRMQWYVITAIGGQEDTIVAALKEKMIKYQFDDKVKEIMFFRAKKVDEKIFNRNSPEMPKTLKNTKTITWEAMPDGRYKRIKTKVTNRFPGYIFINADLDPEIWYAIRNTIGVLGFVGSSGKGAFPIPCSVNEYQKLLSQAANAEYANRIKAQEEAQAPAKPAEVKVVKPVLTEAPFKVGQTVIITNGTFADTECNVVSINLEKQTAEVEFDFFGRVNTVSVPFSDVKLAK